MSAVHHVYDKYLVQDLAVVVATRDSRYPDPSYPTVPDSTRRSWEDDEMLSGLGEETVAETLFYN